ncbi:F-box/FBD/LRR-repeat protein At5g53840 [Linum perenne]
MAKSESGKDRISDLPEGIVHCILRRLQTPEQAGRTIILSRRWQSIWQSYPFVEFHPKDELTCSRDREHRRRIFQQFIESSIRRFSQDTDLPMKSLKVKFIEMNNDLLRDFDQLLDLALRRKAEKIDIDVPLRNLPVSTPNSVRFLPLSRVGYQNFTESMANFQLLETLELDCINAPRSVPRLKMLLASG